MPELKWDEQDFLECLGVVPEVEEYETAYSYTVKSNGLTLLITVWQYESLIQLSLFREGQEKPITSFALVVRGPVEHRNEKWGEYLLLRSCVVVSSRFYYMNSGDVFEGDKYPHGLDVEIAAYPDLRITFA